MKAPDLAAVFGPEGAPGEEPDAPEGDMEEVGDPEAEDALDSAIDDALNAEDPAVRREAFKTAVRLCKEADY